VRHRSLRRIRIIHDQREAPRGRRSIRPGQRRRHVCPVALVTRSTGPASFCCPSCAIAEKQSNKQSTAAPPALQFAMILRSCSKVHPQGQYSRINWHRTPLIDDPPSLTITAF
jgi:hypothetical protein